MIRVARFISFFSGQYGGPVRHIKELTKHLEPYPIETTIYSASNMDNSGKERTFLFQRINSKFIIKRFNSYIRFRDYRITPRMFQTLLKDSKNIDIFHSHAPRCFQEDIGVLVALLKKKRKRFVITSHGAIPLSLNYFQHFYERLKDLTMGKFEKKFLDINYIAITKFEQKYLRQFNINEERIHYIPYGVDIHHFKPTNPEEIINRYNLENKQIILYVGRIFKDKRIDVLLNAFALLKDDFPDSVVVLAGGDFGHKPILDLLIKKLGIRDRVIFLGHLERPILPKVYSMANILVLPSKSETFGVVLVEANACGKPVIASNHWGPREIILEGKTGYLIDFEDFNSMKERISRVLESKKLQEQMGRVARAHIIENFSWKTNAKKHYELYKRILEDKTT